MEQKGENVPAQPNEPVVSEDDEGLEQEPQARGGGGAAAEGDGDEKDEQGGSADWSHFDRIEENGKKWPKCKHCGKKLSRNSRGTTSNSHNHMKACIIFDGLPVKSKRTRSTPKQTTLDGIFRSLEQKRLDVTRAFAFAGYRSR